MHDRVAAFGQGPYNSGGMADIADNERVIRVAGDACEVIEIARVGELVEVDDPRFRYHAPDELGPDEPGAPGDEDGHQARAFLRAFGLASDCVSADGGAFVGSSASPDPPVTFFRTSLNSAALRGSTFGGGACSCR